MSAQLEEQQGIYLPPMGKRGADEIANASMTRWIWNPYKTITNVGPLGMVRQIGFQGDHRYEELRRCTFYPLGNIHWSEVDTAKIAEEALSGLASRGETPTYRFTKYAFDQAQELHVSYGDSYGLRVFNPGIIDDLSWVDDFDLVRRIAGVLQPVPLKVHEMERELTTGARSRIADSALAADERELAEAVRTLMLAGSRLARIEAQRAHRVLIQSMSDAAVGKPGISTPNEFDEWLCDQLGVTLPVQIDKTPRAPADNSGMERAVNVLVDRAVREDASERLAEQLSEEREARRRMEERLAALEQTPTKAVKGKEA